MSSFLNNFSRMQPKDGGEFIPDTEETLSLLSDRALTKISGDVVWVVTGASLPKSKSKKIEQYFYSEELHASISKYAM